MTNKGISKSISHFIYLYSYLNSEDFHEKEFGSVDDSSVKNKVGSV